MALTYAQIVNLIQTNLADFSNIKPDKHREVEQAILDYIVNQTPIIGMFDFGDVNASPTGALTVSGVCATANKTNSGGKSIIDIALSVTIPTDYLVFFTFEYNTPFNDNNITVPIVRSKMPTSFQVVLDESSGSSQDVKVYFNIIKI